MGMAYKYSSEEKGGQWKGSAYERASSSFHDVGYTPLSATQKGMESDEQAARTVGSGGRQEEESPGGLEVMGLGCMAESWELVPAFAQIGSRVPCRLLRRER
jgi:hypothetical protein